MQSRFLVRFVFGLAVLLPGCASPPPPEPVVASYSEPEPDVTITAQPRDQAELECLAKTIYFEARGESEQGQRAVAAVVLNRVKSPKFPNTICEVVHQGGTDGRDCQFSWWCDGRGHEPKDVNAWIKAATIAREMIHGAPDPTNGALYFHTTSVSPSWRTQLRRMATIGAHIYYR
jgi:spore germination cell wall hydrolase CwlJ-like protein